MGDGRWEMGDGKTDGKKEVKREGKREGKGEGKGEGRGRGRERERKGGKGREGQALEDTRVERRYVPCS